MNSKISLQIPAIVITALLMGCARIPVTIPVVKTPGVTPATAKEKPDEKTLVEVVDFKMEKIEKSLFGDEYGAIKITGTAIYHGTGKFADVVASLVFSLHDKNGKVVRRFEVPSFACGEYKRPENIVPGKPFPFESRDDEIRIDHWKAITEARFEKVSKL